MARNRGIFEDPTPFGTLITTRAARGAILDQRLDRSIQVAATGDLPQHQCEVLTQELAPRINLPKTGANAQATEHHMKATIFKIEGMNCDACANTIRSLVEKEPGVRMASVSFNDRQARVLYDPKFVEEERLVDAIQKPGFRVVGREAVGEASG